MVGNFLFIQIPLDESSTSRYSSYYEVLCRRTVSMLTDWRQFGRRLAGLLFLAVCCCAVSCNVFPPKEKTGSAGNPLQPMPQSAETIGIDVFVVRVPYHNREQLRQLWAEVDEQWGSPTLRRELMDQGLRIGVQGVSLSPTLATLINATATPQKPVEPLEISVADLQKDPPVQKHSRNMRPGMQTLLQPYADPVPEMPLFWSEGGQLCGKTFKDAEGLIGLVATPLKGGQVRFDITPEIIHGTLETKIHFQGGVMFPETAKPKHVFYNLAVSLDLLPGQWIVIGPASENCSGIGRCFFVRARGEVEQKVILLRLARSQRDTVFDDTPLPEIGPADFRMLERN